VALGAGVFALQDFVSLKARHQRRWRVFVGNEEKAAPAMADAGILALQPGTVRALFGTLVGFMRSMPEWICDHGDRDLSYRHCSCSNSAVQRL
jgi:hypothetical protein